MSRERKRKAEGIAALSVYGGGDDDEDLDEEEEEAYEPHEVSGEVGVESGLAEAVHTNGDRQGGANLLGMFGYEHDEVAPSPDQEATLGETGESTPAGAPPDADGDAPTELPRTPMGQVHILTPTPKASPAPQAAMAAAKGKQTPEAELDRPPSERLPAGSPLVQETADVETAERQGGDASLTNGQAEVEEGGAQEQEGAGAGEGVGEFLPPPPPASKCPPKLLAKFAKFMELRERGITINEKLRNTKGYRNPDFMQQLVDMEGIDEIGSCFPKDVFDPHGYDPHDFYDALLMEQRREAERREAERKAKSQVQFQAGGIQLPPAPKPVVQIVAGQKGIQGGVMPGAGSMPAGMSSMLAAAALGSFVGTAVATAAVAASGGSIQEGRMGKRSKWDRVEQDDSQGAAKSEAAVAAARAHAALITASASASSAATQVKRREGEEKAGSGQAKSKRR